MSRSMLAVAGLLAFAEVARAQPVNPSGGGSSTIIYAGGIASLAINQTTGHLIVTTPAGTSYDAGLLPSGGSGSVSLSGIANGSLLFASGGILAGVTVNGDGTLNTATGALAVSKIGGVTVNLGGALTTVGSSALTLVTTGPTSLTLPVTGTLATLGNLNSYATTTSLSAYATTSALTSALSGYATTSALSAYASTSALAAYAPLSNAILAAPSIAADPAAGDNTSKIPSTRWVLANLNSYATTTSLSAYATTSALTSALSGYATTSALSAYASTSALAAYAPLSNAILAAPSIAADPAAGDNTSKIPSTRWVLANQGVSAVTSVNGQTGAVTISGAAVPSRSPAASITTDAIVAGDAGGYVNYSNSGAATITVIDTGAGIAKFVQINAVGAGALTFQPGSGVTLQVTGGTTLASFQAAGPGANITLEGTGTGVVYVKGEFK